MGWSISRELNHLENFINGKLEQLDASSAEMGNNAVEVTKRNLAADRRAGGAYVEHEYIELWYIAPSGSDDKDYIGLMLLDYDGEAKVGADLSGLVYDNLSDGAWPKTDELVQAWGYKLIGSETGYDSHSCPVRFLDMVKSRGDKQEDEWRSEVRGRAAA